MDEFQHSKERHLLPHNWINLISAIFSSFSDAPDGFSKEEITTSIGLEYTYLNMLPLHCSYFIQAETKSNISFITSIISVVYKKITFDLLTRYRCITNSFIIMNGTLPWV
ncbi:MAG: hypothetical protein LBL90_05835 [Prevotellaceae bacterium]|jgi:hypothetical protein|nr:hypothetical protein [Prevotellaceae bacterium]